MGALSYYWEYVQPSQAQRKRAAELSRLPIRVPTTIVLGTVNRGLQPRHLRALPHLFPKGVEVRSIPGVGHFPHRESFTSFTDILNVVL